MDMTETPSLSALRNTVREWVMANRVEDADAPYSYSGLDDDEAGQRWYKKLAAKRRLGFRRPHQGADREGVV